jgi:hypothetical protein
MANVVPPPTSLPLTPVPTAAPVLSVPTPSAALLQLPLGSFIDANLLGQILGRTAQIATPFGNLTAQTGFPLPERAALGLQLVAATPQLQLRIVSVNGRPLPPTIAGRAIGAPGLPSQATQTGTTAGPLMGGSTAATGGGAAAARPALPARPSRRL